MRIFILTIILLFAVDALAAKLTWTIESTAGTVAQDGPIISDVNMTRFVDWLWYAYPQVDVDQDGVETPKPRTPANEAQAFRDWAARQWNITSVTVRRWEGDNLAQTAREGVGDID